MNRDTRLLETHVIFVAVLIAVAPFAFAADAVPSEDREVRFNRDIRPILADKCFQCHGPDARMRKADLRLDKHDDEGAIRGGASVLSASDIDESELIQRITSSDADERMPPPTATRHLTLNEIALLKSWVLQGAKYESHWAFISPVRPRFPEVKNTGWPNNGIDYFVLGTLEKELLTPSPTADRSRLARRVSLDLIGLPPDWATVKAFAADESPQAYERLVDRLLKSPRYGEHWAVMWLDAARYADTNGYNNDTPRYNWAYRDWVIQALNRNLPYDQFVTEQLAGDLLPNATIDQQIATGFNRNHNVTSEGGIIDEEYRLEYVADRVHTTATAFMALTIRCARCHDHKFDPISQREYYQLFAFFNQVPETGYHKEHVGNPKPVIKIPTARQRTELNAVANELAESVQRLARIAKNLTEKEQATDGEFQQLSEINKQLTAKHKALDEKVPTAMVMLDMQETRETFMLTRGAYDKPAGKVEADVPSIFPPYPDSATRNRLGFSRWLVSPQHPLTARVIVNRIWAEVFGRGLVTTLEDFGTQGASPSHPELLDWLAVELVESGWDLHHILRLMVMSSTYRQTAAMTPDLLKRDPENRLYGRGPRFRMKAEVLRDAALAASGSLVHKLGGPSVRPYQPVGLWVEVQVTDDSYSGGPYVQSKGDDLYRRSLYTWWKRTCPPPNLNTFDAPEREFCRVQRSRTNTPLQALVLLNDPTFVEAARQLAQRAIGQGGQHVRDRISLAFQLSLSRAPQPSELSVLTDAFMVYRKRYEADPVAAKRLIAVGDSKPLATIVPAELAAYTAVANIIFNLDEFVTK
ncbi:MAG: PSD1 and planctomycete cytochrome C domain-containing protein [Pirellulaceae bacterium]